MFFVADVENLKTNCVDLQTAFLHCHFVVAADVINKQVQSRIILHIGQKKYDFVLI